MFLTSRSFAHLSLPASIVLLLYFCFPCLLFVHIGNIYPSTIFFGSTSSLFTPFCVQAPHSSLTSWHSLVMRETSVKAESRVTFGKMDALGFGNGNSNRRHPPTPIDFGGERPGTLPSQEKGERDWHWTSVTNLAMFEFHISLLAATWCISHTWKSDMWKEVTGILRYFDSHEKEERLIKT